LTSNTNSNTSDSKSHQHDAISNELQHRTTAFIQKDSISLRKNGLSKNSIAEHLGTLASIPSDYTLSTSYFARYPKAILNDSTEPGVDSGSNTHQHDNSGGHTHTVTIGHDHPTTGTTAVTADTESGAQGGSMKANSHSHTITTPTSSDDISPTIDSNDIHQHPSTDHKPDSIEVALIKRDQYIYNS